MLGTVGGLALMDGTAGLLFLKRKMDTAPATDRAWVMDIASLVLLLIPRATPAMGTLLAVHLGVVAGFFITMPYGKFVYAVYPYTALVRYAIEKSRAGNF